MQLAPLIYCICAMAASLACAPLNAQPAANPQLDRYLATPEQIQLTIANAAKQMDAAHMLCQAAQFTVRPGARVLDPVIAGPDGTPTRGTWSQDVTFQGCGYTTTQHSFVTALPDGRIRGLMGVPGDTQLDLFRQMANLPTIQKAVPAMLGTTCTNVQVVNSVIKGSVTDQLSLLAGGTAIREDWWLDVCGRRAIAPVDIVIDKAGQRHDGSLLTLQGVDQPWP